MEHSVLGGSQKYQVKEPFVELIKGSLKTFLNAFTFPDKTVYPVASTNLQDFYNLVDVYLDAVFFPLITPHHLDQEGWHFELDDPQEPLVYKGVVFNEMKGAFSSPDGIMQRHSFSSLFPDNPYGFESGGDPVAIPDLTYEQFKSFHETYYHPANSLIYFYGDDDPQERLRLLDAYLSQFEFKEIASEISLQAPFAEPQRLTLPYSIDAAEEDDGREPKSMIQVNWALPEFADAAEVMALSILSYALVSTAASPLRKALIDSGFGEDITGGGLSTSTRQMTFAVGLKGVAQDDLEAVEKLIFDTLQKLAEEGLEEDMVAAALNTMEFSLRENNTGGFPRGLAIYLNALDTWLYGRDPLLPLRYEAPLAAVKEQLANNSTVLQELIQTHLLQNVHRSVVVLEPDALLAQRMEEDEQARLAVLKAGMNESDLLALVENTQELRRLQGLPDSPEALATLPMLTLADLAPEGKTIPIEVSGMEGGTLLYHDLFTNGIVYLDIGFDLQVLPQELLPYIGVFGSVLLSMGTEREDFAKLSQRIGRTTGGIGSSTFTSAIQDAAEGAAWFLLRGKATMAQAQDMLDVLRDVLLIGQLDNQERFKQIVLRAKAGTEAGLVPGGHAVASSRLRAHFDPFSWVDEQIDGLDQLFFLRKLAEDIDKDWPAVLAQLHAVRDALINRQAMTVNVTLDADNWNTFAPQLSAFVAELPGRAAVRPGWTAIQYPTNEGLTIPAQVNYVAKGANLYDLGYELDGSINVINNYLRTTWLWEKVRVQGGAYGAFCTFGKQDGVYGFLSYRDPNLLGTLANYDGTAAFLRELQLSEDELTKSIIGTIGSIDAYQLPDAKGFSSMIRYLVGESDEKRQRTREQVLSTTQADFLAFADVLDKLNEVGHVVVLGSAEAIGEANKGEPWLKVLKIM
jgi:Zn-dependent M16 (insulinase) family peptidase